MLEYEWEKSSSSSSSIMYTTNQETAPQPDPIFDPNFINPETHFAPFYQPPQNPIIPNNITTNFSNMYNYFEPADQTGFVKPEPVFSSGIGLNLGGRTYFASSNYSEDDFVNRFYHRRSRIFEPAGSVNSPKCQAEGCHADLSNGKHYHRRHKVCEFHSKAATVVAAGLTQRFCQQCSRFHLLSEFDNGKRSCRRRLADHNRRRRKSSQQTNQENSSKSQLDHCNAASENLARSPPDSGPHFSSVTAAISSPRISLDCFGHRPFSGGATSSSTVSMTSLFYSNE